MARLTVQSNAHPMGGWGIMERPREIRNERFRQKLLQLFDGNPGLTHHIYNMNYLVHGDAIANWLLRRGLKGVRLQEWIQEKHQGSFLKMVEFIVADVNRAAPRAVRYGVDYVKN